ncbi:hypothetical protein D3C81_1939160 [compost metagenome]
MDAADEDPQGNGQEHGDLGVGPQGMEYKLEHGANFLSGGFRIPSVLAREPGTTCPGAPISLAADHPGSAAT